MYGSDQFLLIPSAHISMLDYIQQYRMFKTGEIKRKVSRKPTENGFFDIT